MLKVKCYPVIDFLYGYLQAKGFSMVDKFPHILHYAGDDLKELKKLVKEDKPDLLINHKISTFESIDYPQVFHPLKIQADLNQTRKIFTNNVSLCKHYYERLGLQSEIILIPSKKKAGKLEVDFLYPGRVILRSLKKLWSSFKYWIDWE